MTVSTTELKIERLNEVTEALKKSLEADQALRNKTLAEYQHSIDNLKVASKLQSELSVLDDRIERLTRDLHQAIQMLDEALGEKFRNDEITKLREVFAEKSNLVENLQLEISNRKAELASLPDEINRLSNQFWIVNNELLQLRIKAQGLGVNL